MMLTEKSLPVKQQSTTPLSTNSPLPEGCEVIRQRLLDLVEIIVASMQQQKLPLQQKLMMQAATPILLMGIQKEEITKLTSFLRCLSGILQAVNDLGSCPQEYET